MSTSNPATFELLLDLSDDDDYATIINALSEYAARMTSEADDEVERIRFNNLDAAQSEEAFMRETAERAERLLASIERQLDENNPARKNVNEAGE